MSETSYGSYSPINCQEGELHKLTFVGDQGILDSYRFFSQDIGSQTDEKDVIQVIELSEALKRLTLENMEIKRNLALTRSTLQSDFFRRLTSASNDLYSRMNQRLDDVERSQRDRVEVVRRAFRTQLSDALSQMSALYEDKIRKKLNHDRTYMESEESVKYTKKIADLTMKLRKYEIKIKELERQVTDLQESEFEPQPTMILDSESELSEKIFEDDRISLVESEVDIKTGEEELKQKEYTEQLLERIEVLETQNLTYIKKISGFEKTIEKLNTELFSSNSLVDVLRSEKQILEEKYIQNEEQYCQRILDLEIMVSSEKEKVPVLQEVPIKEKPAIQSIDIQKSMKEFPDLSKEVFSLNKIIKDFEEKEKEVTNEINKIKNKTNENDKTYLEQIKVLQSINDKLRNELFTRHQLQSHFKSLHNASVKYAKGNRPMGILPSNVTEKETLSRSTHYSTLPAVKAAPQISEIDPGLLNNFIEMKIN